MDERVLQFRIGVVVVATIIITAILIVAFNGLPTAFGRRETLYIAFEEAPGVMPNTPVRKSGILIGRVEDVELLDEGGVQVTAGIDRRYPVLKNETARIVSASLFGDAVIEFVPSNDPAQPAEPLGDGAFIQGEVAQNPLEVFVDMEGRLTEVIGGFKVAAADVSKLARNVDSVVVDNRDNIDRVMVKTEEALDRFNSAMQSLREIAGDEEMKAQLKSAVAELPEIVKSTNEVLKSTDELVLSLQNVAARAEENMEALKGLTGPLGERGPALVSNLEASTEELAVLLKELSTLSAAINNQEGTLGKLAYDKELYNKLDRTVGNVELLTVRLRPAINDLRVAADKIARDPSRLGVRGAIEKRNPLK